MTRTFDYPIYPRRSLSGTARTDCRETARGGARKVNGAAVRPGRQVVSGYRYPGSSGPPVTGYLSWSAASGLLCE